jgi:hypothetical protein
MSRVRDIANILSGGSSAIATDAEITSAVSNQFVAGKNKVLNGDFKIWQRGGGAFTSSNAYTADRWVPGANQPFSISRQNFTPGAAPVAGYEGQHFLRIALTASSSTYFVLIQKIEDIRTFAGQTVTLSYWAKADANVTNTASYERSTNSATLDSSYAASNVIGTTWQRYTATFNVPTISGATVTSDSFFGIKPILIQDGLAHTIDIWGVQVEAGSTATNFQTATGNPASELAACQRYFWQAFSNLSYASIAPTNYDNSGVAVATIQFPVTMRVAPTLITTTGSSYFNWRGYNGSTLGNQPFNGVFSTDVSTTTACAFYVTGLTTFAGGSGRFIIGSSSATLGFSSEI